ncbi:MAG: hypothetical protein Q4C20_12315 [Erysipelotrichaceae bacterium]|nr:hypothetical protein [Erysipelotrichaceae bacterium]
MTKKKNTNNLRKALFATIAVAVVVGAGVFAIDSALQNRKDVLSDQTEETLPPADPKQQNTSSKSDGTGGSDDNEKPEAQQTEVSQELIAPVPLDLPEETAVPEEPAAAEQNPAETQDPAPEATEVPEDDSGYQLGENELPPVSPFD